jgi:pSer/pThr/pTyr-binding forkhead associated (FHA) protein
LLTGVVYFIIKSVRKSKPVTFATLVELNGMGTKHVIQQTAIRIGRSSDNDIRLMNDSISSHHAEIHRRREGDFYIVDLASTNGLFVNDEKVHQGELKNNDIIELGEVRLRFGLAN